MAQRLLAITLILMFTFVPIVLAGSDTNFLDIYKPAVGELDWGEEMNDNLDIIDKALGSEHTLDGTHYNLGVLDPVPSGIELYVRGSAGISEDLTVGKTASFSNDVTISGTSATLNITEILTPSATTSNSTVRIFVDAADGDLKAIDDDGQVVVIADFTSD